MKTFVIFWLAFLVYWINFGINLIDADPIVVLHLKIIFIGLTLTLGTLLLIIWYEAIVSKPLVYYLEKLYYTITIGGFLFFANRYIALNEYYEAETKTHLVMINFAYCVPVAIIAYFIWDRIEQWILRKQEKQ